MRFEVEADALVEELALVRDAVAKRDVIASLTHVLLGAEGDRLTLSATDMGVSLTTSCPARVAKRGAAVLPAAELERVAKSVTGTVTVDEFKDRWYLIQAGTTKVKLPGLERDDFPKLPAPGSTQFEVSRQRLAAMLRRTLFIPRRRQERLSGFDGVILKSTAKELHAVSTNGATFGYCKAANAGLSDVEMLVPTEGAGLLLKLLDASDNDNVQAGAAERHLYFVVGRRVLCTGKLEFTFPAHYPRLIEPKPEAVTIEAQSEELAAAIRTASIVASSGAVSLQLSSGTLAACAAGEKGDGRRELAVEYEGRDRQIAFTNHFLMDFLAVCGSERVSLSMVDAEIPMLFRPVEDGDFVYRYVVAPRRP